MAEFAETRQKLDTARVDVDANARELQEARLTLARLKSQRRARERSGTEDDIAQADQSIAAQQAKIDQIAATLGGARADLAGHLESFAVFTDPRERIGELSDSTPILLLPLRMETRFKPNPGPVGTGGRLLVRAYPDDIAVDAFEETLSESEILRAEAYWANIWRSGGVEDEDRGAWAVLVGAAGSGRAYWITRNFRPVNEAEKPVKDPATPSVNLIIATRTPLVDPERAAVFTFWEDLWRAGTDAGDQQDALDALVAAVGAPRAEETQKNYAPGNFADEPPIGSDRATVALVVSQLVFPAEAATVAREGGWSQAPHVDVMPDRLVLIGYNDDEVALEQLGNPIPPSLRVGPDPSASKEEQIQRDGEEIFFGEEYAWIADFDKAVEIGMGFVVELDALQFRRGFDKLLVLGVRLAADEKAGQAALETLFDHHQHGRSGLSILPQGRPTNNVEGEGAAYSWREDPSVSFDHYFGSNADPDSDQWFERSDGRWLATGLGLKPDTLRAIPFYRNTDTSDAFAMNVALWPATIGYFMDAMMDPVFAPATVERTRSFFTRHVTARGAIPAIRVGKQPYGILPATPRSRMQWLYPKAGTTVGSPSAAAGVSPDARFLQQVYELLRKVEADWSVLLSQIAHVGKPGDAHQTLLDVVGMHPASVEFYQRYAESAQHLYNKAKLDLFGSDFWEAVIRYFYVQQGLELLTRAGWVRERAEVPDILEKIFLDAPNLLKGGLIDDRPLSESDPIHAYANGDRNYLTWLADAAGTSHDALRLQQGFNDGVPTALLYLMMHHALDLSFVETSRRLFLDAGLLDAADYSSMRRDAKFLQIKQPEAQSGTARTGSRWDFLYRREASITRNPALRVAEYIPTIMTSHVATAYLARQLDALRQLEKRPTAALERLFVEHLDLCSYRLDAWYGGLMSHQLSIMRGGIGAQRQPRQGLYLGAFGWIEHLRPENKLLSPVNLDGELGSIFNKPGEPPLTRDSKNAGYIHAPSLNHAVTAAILRNGYLSNATPSNPGSLAINLSSERVRLALGVIEGMRGEQSLSALLGYQFERGLHDRHDVEVDAFIYDLRKAFPLRGDRFSNTKTGANDEIGRKLSARDIEARNVIDGLALIEHVRTTGNAAYPFGVADLPAASPAQRDAISAEADRIANIADAVADVAMAESVHQVAQGNYEGAGATLDTYSKGKFPAVPAVVTTPRSGVTLTHRVALHLEAGLNPADAANITPRAKAEPALNAWLTGILPPASAVACIVTITDDFAGTETIHNVTQLALGLTPIDLLYLLDPDSQTAMRALDDAIALRIRAAQTPRPNARIAIDYRSRIAAIPGHVPIFELAALVRSCRALLLRSRPLRATDMSLANEAARKDDAGSALELARASLIRAELATQRGTLETMRATLQGQIDASSVGAIIAGVDANVQTFAGAVLAISAFAHPDIGSGSVIEERGRIYGRLHDMLRARIISWTEKLDAFDAAIAAHDPVALGNDDARFIALHRAETHILAIPSDRPPAMTPGAFLFQLSGTTRTAFLNQLNNLENLRDTEVTLGGLYAGIDTAKAAIAPHDVEPLDTSQDELAIISLAGDIAKRSEVIVAAVDAQLAAADAQITAHAAAVQPKDQLGAVGAAIKALLGESFLIVPEFALASTPADEWANAWGAGPSASTAILDYLKNDRGRLFPVDDWAAGVARVREKFRHLERVGALTEALRGGEITLQPLQFPYRTEDYWLGLEHPPLMADGTTPFLLDEDKLLYSAVYASPFDETVPQCGLLFDEWTEVIPARTEDTGLTFHYDRPNSEPPQTLLLALPSDFTGAWKWTDLVDTVHETMDLAKRRAIEPTQIDATAYSRFLPAIISSTTVYPITASLNFAFSNNLATAMLAASGADDE